MILAATNPETSGFGWAYALSAIGVAAALIALGFLAVLIERAVTGPIRRHVRRADAIDLPPHATVPRQLQEPRRP